MDNVKEQNGKSKYAAYTLCHKRRALSYISNDRNKRTKAFFDDADNVYAMHFCFISIGSVVLDVLFRAIVILYILCSLIQSLINVHRCEQLVCMFERRFNYCKRIIQPLWGKSAELVFNLNIWVNKLLSLDGFSFIRDWAVITFITFLLNK